MNIWENAVITNKGLALLAKLVSGTSLTITKAQTGSGYVTPGLLQSQTAVSSPKQTMSFRPVSYPEEGKVRVPAFLTNDDLETGYTAMQVGFFAQDPDEGEILYFIAQAESGTGTTIPSESEMPGYSAEWDFYFQFGRADSVTVTVDPTNAVSYNELQAELGEVYKLKGGTAITSSADLNDYSTVGNYYAYNNTIAGSLGHCPTRLAFTMKVEYAQGTGYVCQTVREYSTGSKFFRFYDHVTSTWSKWVQTSGGLAWTTDTSLSTYKKIVIDPNGSDDNPGTVGAPMATIAAAIRKYAPTCKMLDIYLNDGTYTQEIGSIAVDTCDISIRSTSQEMNNVTLNITQMIDVWVGSLRFYHMTINMQAADTRAISVETGRLFCYKLRVNMPVASTASCINVYNGALAWLFACVLNSGTGSNAGACAYGNQAMLIKAVNCTTERTVMYGFYAYNASNIEYTATVTATNMTREGTLGKCYLVTARPGVTGVVDSTTENA